MARRNATTVSTLPLVDNSATTTSNTTTINKDASFSVSKDPCILILDGWSPGPLWYIRSCLEQHYPQYRLVQPNLDMPPISTGWWCNWPFGAMMLLFGLFLWYARQACHRVKEHSPDNLGPYYQCVGVFFLMGLLWFRALLSQVVRGSMQRNLAICQAVFAEHRVVLVIGFSWGGSVAAELAAQGYLEQSEHDQSSLPALLVAPTTSLVSLLSIWMPFRQDAALRLTKSNRTTPHNVHVVHGTHDSFFCPHPERWYSEEESTGIHLTMLNDNHIFQHPNSQRDILNLVRSLIPSTTTSDATSPLSVSHP